MKPKVSQAKVMTQVQMSFSYWLTTASLFSSLFLQASVLFLFTLIILLPIGQVLTGGIFKEKNTPLVILLGLGLSPLFLGLVIAMGLLFGLGSETLRLMLWILVVLGCGLWVKGGHYLGLARPEVRLAGGLCFLAFIFCFWVAVHPNGEARVLHPGGIQQLGTSKLLPPDNLLSYNFSRYIVERLDPKELEILPTWSISDRGPLSGLVNAAIFLLLGLKETRPWLDATPELFFVYQGVMMFLNLTALFCIGLLGHELFGKRVSGMAMALITSSAFFYQNTIYTWPKAFATFYILCAVYVFTRRLSAHPVSPGLVGVLLAGSVLCHPLGSLYVLGFCVVIAFLWLVRRDAKLRTLLREMGIILISFLVVHLPWSLFKWFFVPSSSRMMYLNLFCRQDEAVTKESFSSVLSSYFGQHGVWDILQLKFANFIYPFDITYLTEHSWYYLRRPWAIVPAISPLTFYQFIPAFGLVSSAVLVVALGRVLFRGRSMDGTLALLFWTGWCSLLIACIFFGCEGASVNHTWAYLAFFISSLLVSCELERMGKFGSLICLIALVSNSLVTAQYFYRDAGMKLVKFGSGPYLGVLAALYLVVWCFAGWQTLGRRHDIEKSQ